MYTGSRIMLQEYQKKKKKRNNAQKKKKMLKDYESKITYLIFCPCKKGHTHILIPCVRSLKISQA